MQDDIQSWSISNTNTTCWLGKRCVLSRERQVRCGPTSESSVSACSRYGALFIASWGRVHCLAFLHTGCVRCWCKRCMVAGAGTCQTAGGLFLSRCTSRNTFTIQKFLEHQKSTRHATDFAYPFKSPTSVSTRLSNPCHTEQGCLNIGCVLWQVLCVFSPVRAAWRVRMLAVILIFFCRLPL